MGKISKLVEPVGTVSNSIKLGPMVGANMSQVISGRNLTIFACNIGRKSLFAANIGPMDVYATHSLSSWHNLEQRLHHF